MISEFDATNAGTAEMGINAALSLVISLVLISALLSWMFFTMKQVTASIVHVLFSARWSVAVILVLRAARASIFTMQTEQRPLLMHSNFN